jgi:cytidylate kinase
MRSGKSASQKAKVWTVTVDGPAAAGKSTVARLLSNRLGFALLDSGALYRGLALHLVRNKVGRDSGVVPQELLDSLDLRPEPGIGFMKLFLGSEDVTELIRDESIGDAASRFSALREVRSAVLDLQRRIGSQWNLVAEGRDMGTVVFPDAPIKFFLTADPEERAKRRHLELADRGDSSELRQVRSHMRQRDMRDRSRTTAPLVEAEDAVVIDTTGLSPEEVVDRIVLLINELRTPA